MCISHDFDLFFNVFSSNLIFNLIPASNFACLGFDKQLVKWLCGNWKLEGICSSLVRNQSDGGHGHGQELPPRGGTPAATRD
jgi:hypothetical protein